MEVARTIGITKSAASRLMGTLEREGFPESDPPTGEYRLGGAAAVETITFSLDNGFGYDISTLGSGVPGGRMTRAAQPPCPFNVQERGSGTPKRSARRIPEGRERG